MTYKDYIKKAWESNSRQRRFQLREDAKKLFPKKFKKRDFLLKPYLDFSYREIVKAFNKSKKKDIRGRFKKRGKLMTEYKDKDFPSLAQFCPRKPYIYYLDLYLKIGKRKNLTFTEHTARGRAKLKAKKYYPDSFKKKDWKPRKETIAS